MPTYSLLDPFEFPYYFYRIRGNWFGPSSGENLLQKWCNFCFSKLLLCKDVFAVGDYGASFKCRAESTRDTYNYGQYLNQFPPNTIKVIREFERIQKRICRHKMPIMFNEICIYIYIYIYVSPSELNTRLKNCCLLYTCKCKAHSI